MRLLLVNPNTSRDMTAAILEVGRLAVAATPAVVVDALQPERGPASIEGQADQVVSAHWALDAVLPLVDRYDAVVVACYSHHPLTAALRELLVQPVLGIMEASILYGLMLGDRFSIVTTSPRWEPLLSEGVRALGYDRRCASVRSSGLSVLELGMLPPARVRQRLCEVAVEAVQRDGASVICLGCAGMAGLESDVSAATGVPVVDGVAAAIKLTRSLVESGLTTSKRGLYGPVQRQPAVGLPPGIASIYAAAALASGPATNRTTDL
ncbi:MAG: aspartate/glutamate racemase family protein [Chloroflexi bacterium]|nr:aspartate/glutamate racemase family protein [Chloroflexota bacterium]